MRLSASFVVLAALLVATCSGSYVALESNVLSVPPKEWKVIAPANPQAVIPLIFAVKLQNTKLIEDVLMDVSDPRRAETYGKHLSHEEAERLVAPAASSIATVMNWLSAEGFGDRIESSWNQGFLQANLTVAEAEELLNTKFAAYRHEELERMTIRVLPGATYGVPEEIKAHLDFVAPTLRFPNLRRYNVPKLSPNNITLFVTPEFLHALYQVPQITENVPDNKQAVVSFIQQFWRPEDLQEFQKLFAKDNIGRNITHQVGTNDATEPGMEANLDVQYLTGVGTMVDTWVWYNGNNETPFLSWLLQVANTADIPNVFSISYGEYENGLSVEYAYRVNTELAKLGARGVSVMVASGDSGAGGNCTNDGQFSPDFPATSPWITAVGGLEGGTPGKTPSGEMGDMISGGGFSNYFNRPSYQDDAVKAYLQDNPKLPPSKVFNASGRAYPDVSAQSEQYLVIVDGIPVPVSGTSCACPCFSGVVSLLNNIRISNGKSALGFLNPFIYQTAANTANSFNDATFGANLGCFGSGFTTYKGWDPVTGNGSPNYAILSKVVADLP